MGIEQTIILGIVSSIIASLVFYLWMILIKPRFNISDKICAAKIDESTVEYKIKVVNLSRAILTNITYSLTYCVEHGDGIKDYHRILPVKEPITYIKQYSRQDKDKDYAVRFSFRIDTDKYPLNDNVKLVFSFQANHSFSNAMKIKSVSYSSNDIVYGFFETGKSLNILRC